MSVETDSPLRARLADALVAIGQYLYTRRSAEQRQDHASRYTFCVEKRDALKHFLAISEANSVEHSLAVIMLAHLNWYRFSIKRDAADIPYLEEALTLLSALIDESRLSASNNAYIPLLWTRTLISSVHTFACQNKTMRGEARSIILQPDNQHHVAELLAWSKSITDQARPDDIIMRHWIGNALIDKRRHTPFRPYSAPMLKWWQDGMDDRYILLLHKARQYYGLNHIISLGWLFEQGLQAVLPEAETFYLWAIKRAVVQGMLGKPSAKKPASEILQKTYWASVNTTMHYRGFRVYTAAIAVHRQWVDLIIDTPNASKDQIDQALLCLSPLTCMSKGILRNCIQDLRHIGLPESIPSAIEKQV